MIYLEIFGREKDGIADATKNIIKSILTQPDTKQLFLIDETSTIIYQVGLDEFRMGSVTTDCQLKKMLFEKYAEKAIYIVPTKRFNVSDVMQEIMFTQFKKEKEKTYCIYYRQVL